MDLSNRDMLERMDLFSRAVLNVNRSQDGACRWQQPLANCDTERERPKEKDCEWVVEKQTQPLVELLM